jgi:hypothetical protein
MKKITAIVLTAILLTSLLTACDGIFGGKSITVSDITGGNATVIKSDKSEQAAEKGAKITAGSRLTTGKETFVYLEVDKDCIIKMNEKSEISVTEITNDVFKFELIKGSVLINENGKDERLQMKAGTVSLTVRGTFFTANYDGDEMIVDLIEGKIDVKSDSGEVTNVEQGNRVMVSGKSDAVLETLDVSNFDVFTMDSVMEYKDVLTDGSLSELDFTYIADFLSDDGVKPDGGDSETSGGDGAMSDDGVRPDGGDSETSGGDGAMSDDGVRPDGGDGETSGGDGAMSDDGMKPDGGDSETSGGDGETSGGDGAMSDDGVRPDSELQS